MLLNTTNKVQCQMETKVSERLSYQGYQELEKKLRMEPTLPTTEYEAAYKLGIQYVLKFIRENMVNGRL